MQTRRTLSSINAICILTSVMRCAAGSIGQKEKILNRLSLSIHTQAVLSTNSHNETTLKVTLNANEFVICFIQKQRQVCNSRNKNETVLASPTRNMDLGESVNSPAIGPTSEQQTGLQPFGPLGERHSCKNSYCVCVCVCVCGVFVCVRACVCCVWCTCVFEWNSVCSDQTTHHCSLSRI